MFKKKQLPYGSLKINLKVLESDYLSDQVTSSVSASNPWVFNEASAICSRFWNTIPMVIVLSILRELLSFHKGLGDWQMEVTTQNEMRSFQREQEPMEVIG